MVQLETTNVYSIISHLKYERHRRSKYQDIDETELELCPGPGAGDHSARAHGAGGQHGPVEHGGELPEEVLHSPRHPGVQRSLSLQMSLQGIKLHQHIQLSVELVYIINLNALRRPVGEIY